MQQWEVGRSENEPAMAVGVRISLNLKSGRIILAKEKGEKKKIDPSLYRRSHPRYDARQIAR